MSTGAASPALLAALVAWQTILRPAAAFTGLTSAEARVPVAATAGRVPVLVAMINSQNSPRRAGVVPSRHRAIPPSELVSGVRLATAPETVAACAVVLGLVDLVVVVDGVLSCGIAARAELEAVSQEHRRGAPLRRPH